ncbi:MAG: GNAT family N-acetyltransferase [Methanomassiliicoccales archaeon]|nr:GNAT family N-acetyltransferase [Methanomassiliicoccales archaeon]
MTPRTDFIIRKMRIGDYEAMVDLWTGARLPFRPEGRDSKESIRRELLSGEVDFLVAESDGEVIGSILCTNDGRKLWINRLCVLPAWQRKGLAGELLKEAEKKADSKGLTVIACLIHEDNLPSRDFFAKKGYMLDRDVLYYSKRKGPQV